MKATIDGITYEGTEDEIRRIVSDPPHRKFNIPDIGLKLTPVWPNDFPRNWDGSPKVTCSTVWECAL